MVDELWSMTDVLLGRDEPPIDIGVGTLMEVAEVYHARASEMEMQIQELEREGKVMKGDELYKLRTGQLRTFTEMTKKTIDLGSRRVTLANMEIQAMQRREVSP